MLAGSVDDAARRNAEAWQLKATISEGGHDLTSGRILIARVALHWLSRSDPAISLGQLRTLIAQPELPCLGGIDPHWQADDILACLRTRLDAGQSDLLSVLVEVLNDHRRASELERFPAWSTQAPTPLEHPWPELRTGDASM
jgi:hypothetical protein